MKLEKYIKKNKLKHRILPSVPDRLFAMAVVIPVYGDSAELLKTLISLSKCGTGLSSTIFLLSINTPETGAKPEYLADNLVLLEKLGTGEIQKQLDRDMNIFWIDAASPGNYLPGKGGVGLARKLGMDSILPYLDWSVKPVIASLDADTIVEPGYLRSIWNYFSGTDAVGASIRFLHKAGLEPELESAIRKYEMFLHSYVAGLEAAGSPYAYCPIGSAMAFTAEGYVRAGGMKIPAGGEDFYFMQALRKIGEIGLIDSTCVHPSARISDRVPFGTGPRIKTYIEDNSFRLYDSDLFNVLNEVIESVKNVVYHGDPLIGDITNILPERTRGFFIGQGLREAWPGICRNTLKKGIVVLSAEDKKRLLWAFHVWFDAFRTLKLIHYLEGVR